MTNQKEIRAAFWDAHYILAERAREAGILTAPQNRHNAHTRAAFVEFLDALHREGRISDALAGRATL
jgi:hypothetical protein